MLILKEHGGPVRQPLMPRAVQKSPQAIVYRYAACLNRDAAIQAAYYLRQSAGMADANARVKFDERFRKDEDARLAYEHGMMSVESPSAVHRNIHQEGAIHHFSPVSDKKSPSRRRAEITDTIGMTYCTRILSR
jgi:hypothetical protein